MRILAIVLLTVLCLSCKTHEYAVKIGKLHEDIYSYQWDSVSPLIYLTRYINQNGYTPLDKDVKRILSYCEMRPESDTVLYIGNVLICVKRHSIPSYIKSAPSDPYSRNYQECTLLDEKDNFPSKLVSEELFINHNHDLEGRYSMEVIEGLKEKTFTRNVTVIPKRKMIVIEDMLAYKGSYISMIYTVKKFNFKYRIQTWKGGHVPYDPTLPNRLMYRGAAWQHDHFLRLSRENFMRLILEGQPDNENRKQSMQTKN